MSDFQYHRPRSLDEALRLDAEHEGARFIAGGTDLMVQRREGRCSPSAFISLGGVPDLAGIDEGPPARIGALTRVSEIVESAFLAARYPALVDAARPFGSVQIRNAATVGGNVCNASPAADLVPALLVHEATATLRGSDGERVLPVQELLLGPGETALRAGELLTGLTLSTPGDGAGSAWLRKTRVAMDIAIVSAAAFVRVEGGRCVEARVAAGAVAPTALRLPEVEAALVGCILDGGAFTPDALAEVRRLANEEVLPITDIRASADYRRHLASVLAVRALTSALERSQR